MNIFTSLIAWTLVIRFSSELQIVLNLHENGGLFPNVIKVIVLCNAISKEEPHRNLTTDDIELPEHMKKPISRNYGNLLISDIKVNATQRYRCTLVTPVPHPYYDEIKTRVKRELKASIPAEYGTCRPGYSLASYERCFPCHPGTYSSGASSQCLPCPKNYYAPLPAQDSCYACPKGSITTSAGANTEDACIYVDDKGKPLPRISTKAIVIISCVALFVTSVIIAFLVWYFWLGKRTMPKKLKPRRARPEIIKVDQSPLFMKDSGPFYRQASNSDEHIYAEIGARDYDSDQYLEPFKPKNQAMNTDLVDDSDSHIYEEPIKLKPVSLSHDSFYCQRPELLQCAYNQTHGRKQKESNIRFERKWKQAHAKKLLNKVEKEEKIEQKKGKHRVESKGEPVYDKHPKHKEDLAHLTNSSELKPICQNSKPRSNIEELAGIILKRQKSSLDSVRNPDSNESEIEMEKVTRLLRNVFREAKYRVDSKEALIGQERLPPVSNVSDAVLIEMNSESNETQTDQPIIPDLFQGSSEEQDRSSDAVSKTIMNISDTPELPEVIDS